MLDKVYIAQKIHTFNSLGVSLYVNMYIKITQHNDFIIVVKGNRQKFRKISKESGAVLWWPIPDYGQHLWLHDASKTQRIQNKCV